jgi:hypothetical protein
MKSALCGSLLAFASLAATLSSAAVPDSTVLHDVRLIDGNGGEPRPHVDVVIRGERIAEVGWGVAVAITIVWVVNWAENKIRLRTR